MLCANLTRDDKTVLAARSATLLIERLIPKGLCLDKVDPVFGFV